MFCLQSEVDYFVNKDARKFLREQFDMWAFTYIFTEETIFSEPRIKQLQAIKDTAYDIIEFLAQFEDELRKIWEKPKFVRGVNYVVTLDKLSSRTLNKVANHKGIHDQLKEWQELGFIDSEGFSTSTLDQLTLTPPLPYTHKQSLKLFSSSRHLPLDTRYFKDILYDILDDLGNLDETLDGELVYSENWQALNTLKKRFKEQAQCVYLDPPYNTGSDFEYQDKFRDSSWLTLMENRVNLAKTVLNESGHIYLQLDHNADYLGRVLLQRIFRTVDREHQTVITWNTGENISGFKIQRNNWIRQADKILTFPKNPVKAKFFRLWRPNKDFEDKHKEMYGWLDYIGINRGGKQSCYIEAWVDNKLVKKPVDIPAKRIGTIWNDIYAGQLSIIGKSEGFSFKTQKPENLLRRVIQACTEQQDLVVDMFAGLGTTAAVAQKLGRKWLAIECGDHFNEFYTNVNGKKNVGLLGRLKIVLSGDQAFTVPNLMESRGPQLSKNINWKGGGFFKYYSLEQYEETLRNSQFHEGEFLELDSAKTPFEQYIFFNDDKLSHAVVVKQEGELSINLRDLYADIDIPETLSNILGKKIRKLTANEVTFEDGTIEKTNTELMNEIEQRHFVSLIKPLLWWG